MSYPHGTPQAEQFNPSVQLSCIKKSILPLTDFGRNKPSKCSMGGRGHSASSPPSHLAAASSVAADFADPAHQIPPLVRHWGCVSPLWMCQLLSAVITILTG